MSTGSFISDFLKLADDEMNFPSGVVMNLPNEDDWSFIIKISALTERALNHLVVHGIDDEPVKELLFRMPLSGKIDLANEREIIDNDSRDKLKHVAKIRNKAAHHILFSFEEIYKESNLLNEFKSNFSNVWNDPLEIGKIKADAKTFILENPKITIFFAVLGALSLGKLATETKAVKKDAERLQELADLFRAKK